MTWTPSLVQTPQLADYESWDVGLYFSPFANISYAETDVRLYAEFNYNWELIADQVAALGNVDAVLNEALRFNGFKMYESPNKIQPYTNNSIDYPQYGQDFGLINPTIRGAGIGANYLGNFVTAFRKRGIKVGFYWICSTATNFFNYQSASNSAKNVWLTFAIQEIKYLNALYKPDFWWVDQPWLVSWTDAQRDALYQALKTPHGPIVINNSAQGATNFTFPCDASNVEYQLIPGPGGDGWYNPVTNVGGTNYYIPKGLMYSGIYDTNGIQWPGKLPSPHLGITYNQVETQAQFNAAYKYIKDRGNMPCFVNMPTFEDGCPATVLDRVTNLDAS